MRPALLAAIALALTAALTLASCQQTPPAPAAGPKLLLKADTGVVSLGRITVGATSPSKTVSFRLDSVGSAQMSYPVNPFTGTHAREFAIGPGLMGPTPVTHRAPGVRVGIACTPRALGRREAKFAPVVVGAKRDPAPCP